MILLEKQDLSSTSYEDRSQLDIKDIYNYAVDLYVNKGLNWNIVQSKLIDLGLSESNASRIIQYLKEQEHAAKISASNRDLKFGLLWIVGGVLLTLIMQGHLIFWGAVVYGIYRVVIGLCHRV
jgi:hypothetical protein